MESSAPNLQARSRLSQTKLDILRLQLRGGRSKDSHWKVSPRPPSENPLSFGQERMLFQLQLNPDATQYHIPLIVRFEGRLNVGALESSLNEFVGRHEALRTGFTIRDGVPAQNVAPQLNFRIALDDLRHVETTKRQVELARLASLEARKPFDLSSPPLLRATLIALGPQAHALLMTVHHIVWDGWSSVLMIREIRELYSRFLGTDAVPPDPLIIQYADFAYWQRRLVASDEGARQIAYWKTQLAGLAALNSLPTDRPRSGARLHRAATYCWNIPHERRYSLAKFGEERKTTLFVTLLSIFQVILFHLGGQSEVVVGTTIAYRVRPEFERLVGFFTNVLMIRTQFRDNPTFETLVSRVHHLALEAQANQDVPFERLVEELAPKRDLSHNPLFQIAIVLHNLPDEKLDLPGLSIVVQETSAETTAFDLVLHISETGSGLSARFEYDADLFDESTIARIASQFDLLTERVLKDPNKRVGGFSLLREDEEAQMLAPGDTGSPPPLGPNLLHQLAEGSAKGDDIAVVAGTSEIRRRTCAPLKPACASPYGPRRAPEKVVAIFVEPAVDMITAILGVLKAGAAYVPLDPSYPQARTQFVLEDCGAIAVVATRETASNLPSFDKPIVLLGDSSLDDLPASQPQSRARAQTMAYAIYTSGSSGQPKGVMVSHENAVASTLARREFYGEPVGGYLLLSSIAFDSSVAGVFWTSWTAAEFAFRRRPSVVIPRLSFA